MYFKAYKTNNAPINYGKLIYDSRVDELAIENPIVVQELNASGSFTCTIPVTHPFYDEFNYINLDEIDIVEYADDNTVIDHIFGGILGEKTTDFFGNKTLTFYGYSIMLHNSYMPRQDFTGQTLNDVSNTIQQALIMNYGSVKSGHYLFSFGDYSSYPVGGQIYSCNETVYEFFDRLKEFYPNIAVNYLTKYMSTYTRYQSFVYLGDFLIASTQEVEVGKNLLDYTEDILDGDFATGVIGYGAETETEWYGRKVRLYVADDNLPTYDKVYWNTDLRSAYGDKVKSVTWDDVDNINTLKSRTSTYASSMKIKRNLKCKLFDLSKITNVDRLEVGESLWVYPPRYQAREMFHITKIERNLNDPSQDNVEMINYY